MQAKISAGTDGLRFLRITGGNLPAPAGNLREAFIVRVREDFFKPRDVSLSSSKHLDQSNHLLPLKTMVNLSNLILFQKSRTVPCWLFKPLSKETARWKSLHYHQKHRELAVDTFQVFSLIPGEGKMSSKSRNWSWIALETQCIFDEHYWFFKKHWNVNKTRNALLFVGEFFLKNSKLQFPRERVTK